MGIYRKLDHTCLGEHQKKVETIAKNAIIKTVIYDLVGENQQKKMNSKHFCKKNRKKNLISKNKI